MVHAQHPVRPARVLLSLVAPLAVTFATLLFTSLDPGPDLVVVLRPNLTRQDVHDLENVLNPSATPTAGAYNPYNVRSFVLLNDGGRWSFRIFFHPRARRRDEFVAKIRASPSVADVRTAPATPKKDMLRFRGHTYTEARPPN